jgi:hypothetical protein
MAGEPIGLFRVGVRPKECTAQLRALSALTAARGGDVKLIALAARS